MGEEGYKVTLNVYDLSQGLARQLSSAFLGKVVEGIWHTGVVVYGNEYYFGGGIQRWPAGTTQYGKPIDVVDLGVTHVPQAVFESYLHEISPRYTAETYSLLTHNCNNFSNEIAQFLVGATIPDYILQLPNEVMSSPMAPLILPMIQNLESTLKAGACPQAPQFRPNPPITTGNASSESTAATNVGQPEEVKESLKSVPPAVEPVAAKTVNGVMDPLGDARSKVQDEISREFAAIMSTGSLHASEAAVLAARKVMQRYSSTVSVLI